jgi:hypothetical protein
MLGDGRDKPGLPATLRLITMSLRPLSSMDRAPEDVVKTAFSPRDLHATIGRRLEAACWVTAGINPACRRLCV